ncbi:uncharacterized protein LOC117101641 [Anneissia japonica]|uniref:uncharacterized protein LOC117101641 n=1 Tax=Anneissia japonica TaxID=1529436 RepID=UPI0014256762|nr:uncharacterized protein LOC117101641 [Anneissia japonica]
MCKCQCMVVGRCRFKLLKACGFGLILAGIVLIGFGIAAFFEWDQFTDQTAGGPIWAGLVAIVTGICSIHIASTLSDDDWGVRGLVCFTLLSVVTMVASIALIGWQLWENDYFVSKDEFKNGDSTDWTLTIALFAVVSFVGLLVVIASTLIGCIGCRCSESSELISAVI